MATLADAMRAASPTNQASAYALGTLGRDVFLASVSTAIAQDEAVRADPPPQVFVNVAQITESIETATVPPEE